MAGLEPASEGVKVPCLTAWLHLYRLILSFFYRSNYTSIGIVRQHAKTRNTQNCELLQLISICQYRAKIAILSLTRVDFIEAGDRPKTDKSSISSRFFTISMNSCLFEPDIRTRIFFGHDSQKRVPFRSLVAMTLVFFLLRF